MGTSNTSATTADACPCCGFGPWESADLDCRNRGGTATLCGFSEYASPSTPPKKYRTQIISGSLNYCGYTNSSCTVVNGFSGLRIFEFTGSYLYNEGNCAESNTQTENFYRYTPDGTATCAPGPPFESSQTRPRAFTPSTTVNTNRTTGKTSDVWVGTNVCGTSNDIVTGEARADLTVEDTEADAITRLNSTLSWSSWTRVGDGSGGTCVASSCCRAEHEQRTSGFSFNWREAEFRVVKSGLNASSVYEIEVEIFRRAYNVGNYVLYDTIAFTDSTDGAGELETAGMQVPNDANTQSYSASARIRLVL
jgi:hypothetical protein